MDQVNLFKLPKVSLIANKVSLSPVTQHDAKDGIVLPVIHSSPRSNESKRRSLMHSLRKKTGSPRSPRNNKTETYFQSSEPKPELYTFENDKKFTFHDVNNLSDLAIENRNSYKLQELSKIGSDDTSPVEAGIQDYMDHPIDSARKMYFGTNQEQISKSDYPSPISINPSETKAIKKEMGSNTVISMSRIDPTSKSADISKQPVLGNKIQFVRTENDRDDPPQISPRMGLPGVASRRVDMKAGFESLGQLSKGDTIHISMLNNGGESTLGYRTFEQRKSSSLSNGKKSQSTTAKPTISNAFITGQIDILDQYQKVLGFCNIAEIEKGIYEEKQERKKKPKNRLYTITSRKDTSHNFNNSMIKNYLTKVNVPSFPMEIVQKKKQNFNLKEISVNLGMANDEQTQIMNDSIVRNLNRHQANKPKPNREQQQQLGEEFSSRRLLDTMGVKSKKAGFEEVFGKVFKSNNIVKIAKSKYSGVTSKLKKKELTSDEERRMQTGEYIGKKNELQMLLNENDKVENLKSMARFIEEEICIQNERVNTLIDKFATEFSLYDHKNSKP